MRIPVDQIIENDYNPNEMDEEKFNALVEEIIKEGGLESAPILVRKFGDKFVIVDGAHRFRAAKKAGLTEVDIVAKEMDDDAAEDETIKRNHLRGELNPILMGKLIMRKMKRGYDYQQISKKFRMKEPTVRDYLKYLNLSPEERFMLEKSAIEQDNKKPVIKTFVFTEEEDRIVMQAIQMTAEERWGKAIAQIAETKIRRQRVEGQALAGISRDYIDESKQQA